MRISLLVILFTVSCHQIYSMNVPNELRHFADSTKRLSFIQTYTPSKLIEKGQWDIKLFNNLYTETQFANQNGDHSPLHRRTFFNSTIEVFTGINSRQKFNIGLITQFRSTLLSQAINSTGNLEPHSPIEAILFQNNGRTARAGWSSIAPAIRWAPFDNWEGFSVQSALHFPLIEQSEYPIFLALDSYIWENRLFYDIILGWERKWQFYTELDVNYTFGDAEAGFANNSVFIPATLIVSYFPTSTTTVYLLGQHAQRIGSGAQNYTQAGLGLKWQFTPQLQIELLYTQFLSGRNTGLGRSYNIGLRYLYL